jgi:hypothetical protein
MNPSKQQTRFQLSRLLWIGFAVLIAGCGPLVGIMAMAAVGMTQDPNPNPVGFGILAAVTLWPSLGLIAIGIWRTRLLNRRKPPV